MSNEDSKTRLLNILKWLEDYQGSKSQSDIPSLSINCDNSSSHEEQFTDDNKLKWCKFNPTQKSPCRGSTPRIVKNCENISTSSSSFVSYTKMSDEKFNFTLANDSSTCEMKHFSAKIKDSQQINANIKQDLELSDAQSANASASPKKNGKSSSKTISAKCDLLQENVDEISENLQFAATASATSAAAFSSSATAFSAAAADTDNRRSDDGGGEDVAEVCIDISNVGDKTLEDPLKSSDDESQTISKSKSVRADQNNEELNSSIFVQNVDVSKKLEKQSQERIISDVGSDKIPTEQTSYSENSNEIHSRVSGYLFPKIGHVGVGVCPQSTSGTLSPSTETNDPLVNESGKSKRYDSPQAIIQSTCSITPENKYISSSLNPNDNPQTVSNYKNTSPQYLDKTLNVKSDSARDSSSVSKPSGSNIVIETLEATIESSQIQDKSSKKDCCTLSSSVKSTDGHMTPDQNVLLDSDEVMIKHQGQANDKFLKTRPNFRDKEEILVEHLNTFSTINTAINATLDLSNSAGVEADIYRGNLSNCPSVYNGSQFKSSFISPRPCCSNDDRRQIPEQCYQEFQPLYYANMSMNKPSDMQYIIYPNSVSSTLCYSPRFQCNSLSNYTGGINDGLDMSSNIFNNHQRINFKPFSSPYMIRLQTTSPETSINEEKTNVSGIRDFIENCQSLQNSYINVPEMRNPDQYTILQNSVLTSSQERQQNLYSDMYNKSNQPDYLAYKTNRLAQSSNNCIKNFNQFISSQELYSQIDNFTVKYPSNPHNLDLCQSKSLTNAQSIQYPTADSSARNVSHPITNVRTDNVSPKQYLTQGSLQSRMEPFSQHSSINKKFDSVIQDEVKSHAGIDIYNKTTGCSVNPLKDSEINRNNNGYLKPNNYMQFHPTANNTFRSSFNAGISSDNSLSQFHQRQYNSEVIHPDSFRDINAWIPKPSRTVPCGPTTVINKDMENTAKIHHQVQPQRYSNLSVSEIQNNGCNSENGQYLQNQMYNTNQALLSQNMRHHQNLAFGVSSSISKLQQPARYTQQSVSSEHNSTETSAETTQTESTQCSFHNNTLSPVDSSGSRINYFVPEYSSGLNGQADNNFQTINVNDPSNAQKIQDSEHCRAENALQELSESSFGFLDNDILVENLIDECKSLSEYDGKYDGSKNGQPSDISDESFLFSDYDPVFLANLLSNDFDSNDYNSAFDEGFEDAASITMKNSAQTENDFIENTVSSFEGGAHNPDTIMVLQNSDNNQHLFNIQAAPDTSISVTSSSTNDDQKSNFHNDNRMKYSSHPNNSLDSFTRKPVSTSQSSTTQIGVIRQRYPNNTVTYQCTQGQTIYAADMVPRIDIDPHASKKRNRSTRSVMGPSAIALEEKFPYDPEVTKRFSDRCVSKTAYQLAESINEFEINRGGYVKKPRISKEHSFKSDNGGFNNRYTDYVNECSAEIQSPNTGIPSKSVTTNIEKVKTKNKDEKEAPRRPRGRPRLSEEVKRERAMKRALQAKSAPRTRIKNNAKMNGKEQSVQQICNPTNKSFSSETDLNVSNDSQQYRNEAANDKGSQIHSDSIIVTHDNRHSENIENPGTSTFNERAKEKVNESEAAVPTPELNTDLSEAPLQLTSEKHLKENGNDVSKTELKENGWFDECSNLSQEERQMKSYLELKKKLDKRQKTNKAPWKCPYLQSKTINEESRRNFIKRKSKLNCYGSTKRNYTNPEKPTDTNGDSIHILNSSYSRTEMQETSNLAPSVEDKMFPTSNNLKSNETMNTSSRNELGGSMELHAEQTQPQNISKTLCDLAGKRQLSFLSSVKQKPPLSEKQNKRHILSLNCRNNSSSPIAMIRPCTPLPIYPPPPPPLFRFPPPPPRREKKVTPRNVNPTIVENARLCYEAIKHQLSKVESDFDSFLISYANVVQGLQNCGAERYRRIKEILLKTSEMKETTGDGTSPENKGVEQSLVTADISENGEERKGMTSERNTNKVLSDIDALSIQGDSVKENPLDRKEFPDDCTELVKIILTSRADEYRNIKLVISRNICGSTDMKQTVNTNQAELDAKKAKLAAYFENVGKMVMMEEKFSKKLTKSRGTERKQKRKRSTKKSVGNQKGEKASKFLANLNSDESNNEVEEQKDHRDIPLNRKKSDLEEKAYVDRVRDTKVCDRKYNLSAGKLKKNRVGRPRKNTISENLGVLNKQCNKEEEEKYSEKNENVMELSSSSDGGFVEESTGDYILGLGTESDDDILFNSVKFTTCSSENDTKCPEEKEKSDLKKNSVTENFSNVMTSTTDICKQHELKGIIPNSPEHTLTEGTDEVERGNSKLSPLKLNTRISSRHSSASRSRKEVCSDLPSVDRKDSKTDMQSDPSAKECVSSFKMRNQSKIVKPKTAVIPKEIRQRKLVMRSQKIRQSKLQRNENKIDDKPIKGSQGTRDNINEGENSAKPTNITDTKNEHKAPKNINPIESCVNEDINLTHIDSDTEMSDTYNIDSVERWKVRKENRKLKRKYSQIHNSVISTKYFNSLSHRALASDNPSESYFPKENAQKRNMSLKDCIPKIENHQTRDYEDGDDNGDEEWIMEDVLRSDSKRISTDANESTSRRTCKRNKRTNIEESRNVELSVPDLKVTAKKNERSKNCISNFGESSNKSNEIKHSMKRKPVQKSSKSGSHAKKNCNQTLQMENIKDVSVTKVTTLTEVLNISKRENMVTFIESTTDHSKINQSTNDIRAKHNPLSCKLTPESKISNSGKGEILKIQSINFEKEPFLIKTATLLKDEESFKTIHETKNIFDILCQTAGTAGNETLTNQTESMDALESSSNNCRNDQYSKSEVKLLKVWDSKSSKLPVLPNLLKNDALNAGTDRKTLAVNCCRLENNLSHPHLLQSSDCIDSIANSDTKTKPNFYCKGILKDSCISPKAQRINKKVRFSQDNDAEESSSGENRKVNIRVNKKNSKISAMKTSKYGGISKVHFSTKEEVTHKNCRIKSDSSTRTSTSKSLNCYEDITHADISRAEVSDASSNDNKSTSKLNHSNTKRTSRRQKNRSQLVCEYCSKQFMKPSQLLYHTRSHTGERPFKCDVCDKAFVSNSHLLRHCRTHSSVKSHICVICERGFSQRYSLLMHENIHSGIKSFKCQKCSVKFRTRESLVKHEKKHHQQQICNPKTKTT